MAPGNNINEISRLEEPRGGHETASNPVILTKQVHHEPTTQDNSPPPGNSLMGAWGLIPRPRMPPFFHLESEKTAGINNHFMLLSI